MTLFFVLFLAVSLPLLVTSCGRHFSSCCGVLEAHFLAENSKLRALRETPRKHTTPPNYWDTLGSQRGNVLGLAHTLRERQRGWKIQERGKHTTKSLPQKPSPPFVLPWRKPHQTPIFEAIFEWFWKPQFVTRFPPPNRTTRAPPFAGF